MRSAVLTIALSAVVAIARATGSANVEQHAYACAERFLTWNQARAIYNNELDYHWIPDTDALWYKSVDERGWRFIVADATRARKRPAFDHDRMATALGQALAAVLTPDRLPVAALQFRGGLRATPHVAVAGKTFDCDLKALRCTLVHAPERDSSHAYSSDGHYSVFAKGANLWETDLQSGRSHALTDDGESHKAYAAVPESSGMAVTRRRRATSMPPVGEFSPDGTKFLTYRLDESKVPELTLLQEVPQDGSFRPKLWNYRYPLPGDPQAVAELFVFDLKSGSAIKIAHPPLLAQVYGPILAEQITWSRDSRALYILDNRDGYRELTFSRADATSGKMRALVSERSTTNIFAESQGQDPPTRMVLANGDFIWSSERTGWRHLYRYDASGTLKNAITSGEWLVREILRVDEPSRTIFFTAAGREANQDPYFRQVYEVHLDGSGLRRLTTEDADHSVNIVRDTIRQFVPSLPGPGQGGFSPSGRFFVDSYARPDLPTVTVVRDRTGRVVMQLERARLAPLIANQYETPEPFKATAADGSTAIYGTLFKPSRFDPSASYPIVDSIYPGPQQTRVSKRFLSDSAQAVAELGFIVVTVDGRGTPLRSRSFRDASYGALGTAGFLQDHIAAIHELARTRPYMDVNRVGIYGGSAGGFATVHALFEYPDFFKVGVAYSGNHDLRTYLSVWGERYQGAYDSQEYGAQASYLEARNFTGKLLLVAGDMDDNVHPANTMRVVDALVKNNKTFDFLILPNLNHAGVSQSPYFIRRLWDYLVVNLRSERPPEDYVINAVPLSSGASEVEILQRLACRRP